MNVNIFNGNLNSIFKSSQNASNGAVGGGISPNPLNVLSADSLSRPFLDQATIRANQSITNLSWDNLTKVITFVNEAGIVQAINLSQFTSDLYVTGGNYNSSTGLLTLIQDNNTPDIVIDLFNLKRVENINSSTTNIIGVGSSANPLQVQVKISALPGNKLSVASDGLYVVDSNAQVSSDLNNALILGSDSLIYLNNKDTLKNQNAIATDGDMLEYTTISNTWNTTKQPRNLILDSGLF